MKTEIFNKLQPYEEYLRQAMKDYMRVPSGKYKEIAAIYAEHFGRELTPGELSCGKCQLRALKRLAEEYYKFKDSPYYKGLQRAKEEHNEEKTENGGGTQ